MKNTLYVSILISLLFSCKSNTKENSKDTIAVKSTANQTQKLIQKFKPIIEGVWVKKEYVNRVAKSKSPYISFKALGGVAEFEIQISDSGDSTHIGYSLNNHEGADFVLYFKTGQRPTSLKINLPDYETKGNFYELGYNIKNSDTTMVLYHYNRQNQIIDSTL